MIPTWLIPVSLIVVGMVGVIYYSDQIDRIGDGARHVPGRPWKMKRTLNRLIISAAVWLVGMLALFLI